MRDRNVLILEGHSFFAFLYQIYGVYLALVFFGAGTDPSSTAASSSLAAEPVLDEQPVTKKAKVVNGHPATEESHQSETKPEKKRTLPPSFSSTGHVPCAQKRAPEEPPETSTMSKAEKPLELPKKVEASDVSNDRSIPSPVRSGVQPVKVSEPKKLDQADTDTEQKQSEPVQKPPVLETTIAAPSLVIKTEKRSRIDNEQEQIPTQERSEISGMNKLEKASQQDRSDKSPGQKQPAQKPLGVTAKAEPPLIKTDPKVKVQIKAEPPLIKTEPKVQIKAEPQIEVPKKQQKRLRPARDPEMELKIVKYGEKIEQMGQYLSELDLCVLATGRGVVARRNLLVYFT